MMTPTNNDDDEETMQEDASRTFCSILNVVIDHSMEPPNPLMEPEEWKQQRETQNKKDTSNSNTRLVPVIRVFGPVLRHSEHQHYYQPLQSACLYIHGAFPYLLARPVMAGPDGSLRRASPGSGQVDWDNAASIERIVNTIAATLETSLHSLDMYGKEDSKNNNSDAPAKAKTGSHPIVRKVTVVEGRGFYTYCPGPPAPFLRVEYYDPKLRWKVKMMLERGLELPLSYHPDPYQYDRHIMEPPAPNMDDNLKFHCYEAHIPYTMQFFKDWNLAGMSYIHISKGKIRGKLADKFINTRSHKIITSNEEETSHSVFLRSNTPKCFQWDEEKRGEEKQFSVMIPLQQPSSQESASTATFSFMNYFEPPKKGTSCDVEIDCTVNDLRNIETVMKSLPSEQEESDRISWRAVPSLQEIWKQERRRMAKLLQPEHDFLSHPPPTSSSSTSKENSQEMNKFHKKKEIKPPPFTLDVKKDAARPGARMAAKGMWSLVGVTYGLKEDFLRSLKQIIDRHKLAIQKVDEKLLQADTTATTLIGVSAQADGKQLQLTPTLNEAIDALGSLATTPTLNEAICALDSLAAGGEAEERDSKQLFPGTDDRKESSSPFFEDGIDFKHSFDLSGGTKQSQLSYPSSQGIHHEAAIALSTTLDPIQYSQRLERGDCVIIDGPGRDLEDFIDPETLLPYDQLDFGEDRCRVIYTVETDPPGTKRICGGSAFCPREGHCDNTPKERAKPAYYKTISTGAFVDGIIDSHSSQFNEPDDDDDENDTERFERSLSVLGTQLPTQDFSPKKHTEIIPPTQYYHGLSARATQNQHPDFAQTMMSTPLNGMFFSYQAQSSIDATIENESEVEGDDHETSITSEIMVDVQSLLKEDVAQSPTQIVDEFPESFPAFVTPHTIPPSRSELIAMENQSYLHLLESNEKPPSWLEHAVGYTQRKENSTQEQILTFSGSSTAGHYVQPVRIPPSRHEVEKWSKKNVRRSPEQIKHSSKRQKAESANEKTVQCRRQNDALEIDSNTRKIVPKVQKTKPAEEGIDSHLHGQHVEEVQWEPSQAWQLTMSQSTQHDQDNGRDVDPHAGTAYHPNTSSQRTLPELNEGSENDREGSLDTGSLSQSVSQNSEQPLDGIGNQGGRIHVHGGGGLKAKTRPSQAVAPTPGKTLDESSDNKIINSFLPAPISFMSIEIHIQCRTGASRLDSKKIPMAPDSTKDKICAVVFVHGRDPGGGESIDVLSRGCIFVPLETETIDRDIQVEMIRSSMPRASMGISAQLIVECVKDEKGLLLRLASIVRMKDPDMLLSWDTQGAGIGYLIERGVVIGADVKTGSISTVEPSRDAAGIDMVRLLGRSPHDKSERHFLTKTHIEKRSDATFEHANAKTDERNVAEEKQFRGSGLGSDWDERVGAGAAAASIVGRLVFSGWKIVAEEVKHANASYLPAVVAAVLNKRIPHHDDLALTQWYARREERWRVLSHRLAQASACVLLFDALDIIGRAGEAARLSGVEFSQSFPGIRGSQYKVEGVLLRALQSLRSDERGSKKGKQKRNISKRGEPSSSSLSEETRSPSQSPWKMRRGNAEALEYSSSLESRHYFFFSPSLEDTNKQEALEVQALTLEPRSGHYQDPVVVCDFTALYPSLVIAYNLCYSTCAGKLDYHSTRKEMQIEGRTNGRVGPLLYPERRTATVLTHHLKSLATAKEISEEDLSHDRAYIAPTGTIYVSEDVLKGVLPQVLDEMLTTRAMLKKAAKEYKKRVKNLSPAILRQLEARQLALKYVANVTYGYTSATFSGRCAMPLLADTIVECGRKTLRRAIDLANQWGREGKWMGCRVIYGDTDSLFVQLPGRSYREAFDFGEELCQAVTADNPPPIQLKLEKVYLGSIMQTMKRYCGMKFESKTQKKPVFEAKGLETVRRDQCALTQKVLRNALITLFRHGIESVKEYLFRQWSLIFAGQLPISDFILTGRVRSKYRGGKEGPVQAVLARRIGEADPGRIIRHKERLPYIIVATPGLTFRLKDCVLTPLELLERWDAYTIHAGYYIEKHVNASLQRCFGLAPHFIDVNTWYQSCPKPRRRIHFWPVKSRSRAMITSYFGSDVCSLCQRKCQASGRARVVVCGDCRQDHVRASQEALLMLNQVQMMANAVAKECSRCNNCFESIDTFATVSDEVDPRGANSKFGSSGGFGKESSSLCLPLANCVCIDCPNTFRRHRLREQMIETACTCEVLGLL